MSLSYTIREGLAAFSRARFAAVAAVSALTIALVLLGVMVLLGLAGSYTADYLSERAGEFEVFLGPEDVSAADARAIGERLRATRGVREATFISAEEHAQIFRQDFGEEAVAFGDLSFLPASYRVMIDRAHAVPDSMAFLSSSIESWDGVEVVEYNRPLVAQLQRNIRVFSIVGGALALLVILASFILVGNTIRLAIYARRLLIRTMKLVGATDAFIRQPFLIEGLIQGAIAGALAAPLVYLLYSLLLGAVPQFQAVGWPGGAPVWTILGIFAAGVLFGWLASLIAVRRFIRDVQLS